MTEQRRIKGDPRLGFADDELEGEVCIECGAPAVFAIEDKEGLTHYCDLHAQLTEAELMALYPSGAFDDA